MRRWMRTIPPYLIALVLASLLAHRLWSGDFFRYLVYLQNFLGPSNGDDYFPIAWSLAVEEWFYVIFPLFLAAFSKIAARRDVKTIVLAAASFIILITVLRSLCGNYANWGPDVRRVVAFRIDSIAYGFLLYLAVDKTQALELRKISGIFIALVLGLALAAGVLLTVYLGDHRSFGMESSFPFYAALFGALCIVAARKADGFLASRPGWAAAGFFLGRISYSVYLFHLMIIRAVAGAMPGMPLVLLFIVSAGMTVAFTALLFTAVEAPILAARPKFAPDAISAASSADR